jgi:hypothetical protein
MVVINKMNSLNADNYLDLGEKVPQDQVHLLDSRYIFHTLSPVSPMSKQSVLYGTSIPSSDMYYPFGNENTTGINQLDYSGGNTQLLRIPLQMNEPNSTEMLRSQDVLITPYNRIKYSDTTC